MTQSQMFSKCHCKLKALKINKRIPLSHLDVGAGIARAHRTIDRVSSNGQILRCCVKWHGESRYDSLYLEPQQKSSERAVIG